MRYFKFAFAIFMYSICAQAQTMYVRPIVGTQTSYAVSNVQKITFSGGNMMVTPISGAVDTYALSENRYVNFVDLTLETSQFEAKKGLYMYPNPATTVLNIENLESASPFDTIEIIPLQGQLLQKQKANTFPFQIDISSLPQGMYLCRITSQNNQSQTLKFIKQ